jgi:hypothetical protein
MAHSLGPGGAQELPEHRCDRLRQLADPQDVLAVAHGVSEQGFKSAAA